MRPVLVKKATITPGQYRDYIEDSMYLQPIHHSFRLQPEHYKPPALGRELTTPENVHFAEEYKRDTGLPLSVQQMGVTTPLIGRHTYPHELFSLNPSFIGASRSDLPMSYKDPTRRLHMYGFEGKTTPQRYARNVQPEGIIYGDVPEELITRFTTKPVRYEDLRQAARALMPTTSLQPSDLREKQQNVAAMLMSTGISPALTSTGLSVQDPSVPEALESIHDPFAQWSQQQQRLNIPTEDLLYTGEPMKIAFQLLKESLELQPPMTQGVEEEQPIEEEMPMVDVSMDNYESPCDCAERVRSAVLESILDMEKRHDLDFSGEYQKWQGYSCQEILQFVEDNSEAVKNSFGIVCDNGGISEADQMKYASEPMDIALQLLKQSLELQPPMTQGVQEEQPIEEETPMVETMDYNNCNCAEKIKSLAIQNEIKNIRNGKGREDRLEWLKSLSCEDIQQQQFYEEAARIYCGGFSEADQMKYTGEPMEIAMQLLKERVSPEAKRHKLEYDKKYESSPERVKYREELNRERRRRGIYGSHDHKDISHTQGGKLTLEGEHENRARHFKDKGTLREL